MYNPGLTSQGVYNPGLTSQVGIYTRVYLSGGYIHQGIPLRVCHTRVNLSVCVIPGLTSQVGILKWYTSQVGILRWVYLSGWYISRVNLSGWYISRLTSRVGIPRWVYLRVCAPPCIPQGVCTPCILPGVRGVPPAEREVYLRLREVYLR